MTPKGIAVLGSTGTIGAYTLEIIERNPDKFKVISLSAGRNLEKLRGQIHKFHPSRVSVQEVREIAALQSEFPSVHFAAGTQGFQFAIEAEEVQVVVVGVAGFAGLEPTLQAIRAGKTVALANKESLVVSGPLLRREMAASSSVCIPVDSEHNALFQLLEGRKREDIASLVLTASGGPLLRMPEIPLQDVTPALAIKHPNWAMGPKISVDSATLMNKGLEVIEAHYLFDYPESQIEVWIHPQSVVHGAVWFTDNSCMAQLTKPDMKSSIGYAMAYPAKLPQAIEKLSLGQMSQLEFLEPDLKRFAALNLARQALRGGQSQVIALNAANEIAVEAFLQGSLLFSQIPELIERTLNETKPEPVQSLETVFEMNQIARDRATKIVTKLR